MSEACIMPELNSPLIAVTEWETRSSFVHATLIPADISIGFGSYALSPKLVESNRIVAFTRFCSSPWAFEAIRLFVGTNMAMASTKFTRTKDGLFNFNWVKDSMRIFICHVHSHILEYRYHVCIIKGHKASWWFERNEIVCRGASHWGILRQSSDKDFNCKRNDGFKTSKKGRHWSIVILVLDPILEPLSIQMKKRWTKELSS